MTPRKLSALALLFSLLSGLAGAGDFAGWQTYGGDEGNTHYSELTQINRENVDQLRLAWRYDSARGAPLPATSELQLNPIVVDGILYGRNPLYNVFALNAATGAPRWTYDPPLSHVGLSNMRGLSLWQGERDKRLFFTTGHFLMALDAETGKPITAFGDKGRVDLRQGLGRDPEVVSINAPSPGVIFEDLIIMGSAVTETAGAAPGDIRAYSVIDGSLVWQFHTIPRPGETGHETWPADAWKTAGGANAWAGMSLDSARGVVYVPTGSPTPDFDGSQRHGANLFGNTLLALDARTGKRIWHFQAVRHDLWDRDLSSAPTLATVTMQGKQRDVVAQASKQGVLYLLDRDSGKPVFPIEEVAVPASDVPGERAFPTQLRVTLPEPFTRQSFSAADLSDINPRTHAYVKQQLEDTEPFAYMRPPGLRKSVLFPGFYGGANWGGGAYDPATNQYYINAIEAPHIVQVQAVEVDKGSSFGRGAFLFRQQCSGCHGLELQGFYPYAPALTGIAERTSKAEAMRIIRAGKGRMMPFAQLPRHDLEALVDYLFAFDAGEKPAAGGETETAYVFAGYNDFVDERYYPAVKPPWGTLTAIDLATGKRSWQIPLGEYEELTREGVPPTGTRNYGGPLVTAGDLLVIAATSDEMLRIFDKHNGELLWQYKLPAAGYATPATYAIAGRQYLVITCSGGKLGTATGDSYLAFALPARSAPTEHNEDR
ncbi:PQQ-binding-like beta-propeller repeat protein [Pseudohalioglobus sediminis]|uniref:PQQ-binding-like beta-propeller repeat protein n=1 Tax=Pseudohalioglobus sediminis TaxID=2606449 RepID=A0A5B0X417_9GAMM|nr:PQQ-binding-like beta-propeller repeat protein [Pseudohalioglobus sediminis]KAA1193287.1 PQQ-binding-like beta-propeller repeat protein [Pseudohalioglobus sediminis]